MGESGSSWGETRLSFCRTYHVPRLKLRLAPSPLGFSVLSWLLILGLIGATGEESSIHNYGQDDFFFSHAGPRDEIEMDEPEYHHYFDNEDVFHPREDDEETLRDSDYVHNFQSQRLAPKREEEPYGKEFNSKGKTFKNKSQVYEKKKRGKGGRSESKVNERFDNGRNKFHSNDSDDYNDLNDENLKGEIELKEIRHFVQPTRVESKDERKKSPKVPSTQILQNVRDYEEEAELELLKLKHPGNESLEPYKKVRKIVRNFPPSQDDFLEEHRNYLFNTTEAQRNEVELDLHFHQKHKNNEEGEEEEREEGEGGEKSRDGRRPRRSVVHLYDMVVCATGCNPLAYKGYGCYCGFLGSGLVVDGIDKCCAKHDWCYHHAKCPPLLTYFVPYYWTCNEGRPKCLSDYRGWKGICGSQLCDCDKQFAECLRKYPCPRGRRMCMTSPFRFWQNLLMQPPFHSFG